MTTTSRKAAFIVMFLFIAGGVLASATRFAVSASAEPAPEGAKSKDVPPGPKDAESVPPDMSSDHDDPKFAAHFSGRVTGPNGQPVSRARVFIAPLSDGLDGRPTQGKDTNPLAVRAEADADGRFEFDAPDLTLTDLDGLATRRRCVVIAAADGYGPDWIEIRGRTRSSEIRRPTKGTDLALQLATDDAPIRGRLLDPDGRPLAGARVLLTRLMIPKQRDLDTYIEYVTREDSAVGNGPDYDRTLSRLIPLARLASETRTDADGRFTLSGLGRERLAELKLSAPSVVDTNITAMTRDAPDVGTLRLKGVPTAVTYGATFTLQLKPGLTVTGVVRDRDTHAPIAGMWVGWRRDPLNGLRLGEYSRTTDDNGRFTITGLDPRLLEWDEPWRQVTAVAARGLPYHTASAEIQRDAEVVIECTRGIPFRLTLLDEQGQPVAAQVTYRAVNPNPDLPRMPSGVYDGRWPISRAAHRGGGSYEGFVLPGPGAVLVKTPGSDYRPAYVDPKAFFAPGRTEWTAQERITAYGTHDTLSTSQVWINQHDYAAIILVKPTKDSGPLELSARVVKDRPRHVSLVDPDGQPVVGVRTEGMTFNSYDYEPPLRAASFALTGLHPERVRRITYFDDDRHLIGFLAARGNSQAPYTVHLQPWGAVTGRIVDENGTTLSKVARIGIEGNGVREHNGVTTDAEGRFRIDRLVPGQRYRGEIRFKQGLYWRDFAGMAFEDLVLHAGEARDLGSIRINPSAAAKSGTTPNN